MSDTRSESESPAISPPTPKQTRPRTNRDWWPNQVDLQVLNQHMPRPNPLGDGFNYAEAFKSLDLEALKRDIAEVLTEMDAELACLDKRREKTRALKQGMMQELLT